MSRPELQAPPELYYDEKEAGKYSSNSRVIDIQRVMAERCVELLNFPDEGPRVILDIGCGSGLSGDILAEHGHAWVGMDISSAMLDVAVERGCLDTGDMLRADMGAGFGFRPGSFDGCVSVSVLQWLCYNDRKDHVSVKRLESFFTSLYRCLRRGARAALQFYPETESQVELISAMAQRCGFTGGLVVDFPNSTKAKKYYLCLFAGRPGDEGNSGSSSSSSSSSSVVGAGGGDGGGGYVLPSALGAGSSSRGGGSSARGTSSSSSLSLTSAAASGRRKSFVFGKNPSSSSSSSTIGAGGGGGGGRSGEEGEGGSAGAVVPGENRRMLSQKRHKAKRVPVGVKSRSWIQKKKQMAARKDGSSIAKPLTKYTGRKRGPKF